MNESIPLGERAFEHIDILARQIGPRPAGSASERQAFEYIETQLKTRGYAIHSQAVPFAPLGFFPLYALGGVALILGGWIVQSFPLFSLLLPLLFFALPQFGRMEVRSWRRKENSQNLLALINPRGEKHPAKNTNNDMTQIIGAERPTLILCAHVDSARASAFHSRFGLELQANAIFYAQRGAIAVAAMALLSLIGFRLPGGIITLTGILGSALGGWLTASDLLNQLAHGNRYSPGANDNASGVGVLLALAEYFASIPPTRINLGFLFTGAEETGMHGAKAFAASLHEQTGNIHIINLDMVGAGNTLHFVTRDGTIFQRTTDTPLNQLIQSANPDATGIWYTLKSGDCLPMLQHHIRATSIEMAGSAEAAAAYHSINDKTDTLHYRALEKTAETVKMVVELFNAYGGAR
jgi:hypothetical protein